MVELQNLVSDVYSNIFYDMYNSTANILFDTSWSNMFTVKGDGGSISTSTLVSIHPHLESVADYRDCTTDYYYNLRWFSTTIILFLTIQCLKFVFFNFFDA